ncbi:tripartite tricarboxylate transporter substrate-binding protein [Hydrogenophaga sp.]|uniref:tripartite tricarboxylate transporter substrate-binding protein n=1 Tax=Hydrogenophaga sp. TaxID=1904254 RepID=UPI00272EF07E|nr:tripartite tricarboxylate transporter substrate-binding protein [Hydrogenophaga sp.]MDP2016418.1 tripartite tricarboxylate transporter substrate-binding protein [Hydrogenophaga sp.]MDP3166175.1 tripartite tricarboxylate transporter substrate-binding protein [Hydrogenophaga sp.]MDP3812326.1 tripartite tricarboxylate transporter substrate-binding protein [Hydrogenophaga sp.]
MNILWRSATGLILLGSSTFAFADFPDRPITLVVPFVAGGPSDKIARDVAEALRKPLGQTVVVENAGGAGGTIGSAKVARAAPDGYTLLVHHIGMATAPALYRKLSYKVPEDFETLGVVNEAPSVLIAKPGLAANNFAELRQWIASSGDKVNLANAGVGSASHLCGLMLQSALKADMTPVPYKGTAPAMTDLLGGQVDLMCEQATNAVPQIEGKKVKVFGVTSLQRLQLPVLKDTPTLSEAGLPGFNVQVWHGLYAPKGTPAAVLARLNAALKVALKDPDLIKKQEALGLTVTTDDRLEPAGHRKFLEAEKERWSQVIKAAGQYAD